MKKFLSVLIFIYLNLPVLFFIGYNFRHFSNISSFLTDEIFVNKVHISRNIKTLLPVIKS